jgi:hypothetical protein
MTSLLAGATSYLSNLAALIHVLCLRSLISWLGLALYCVFVRVSLLFVTSSHLSSFLSLVCVCCVCEWLLRLSVVGMRMSNLVRVTARGGCS